MSWRRPVVLLAPAIGIWLLAATYSPPPASETFTFVVDGVVGLTLIVAGLISWERRPASRAGRLLVFAGYLWYVGDFGGGPIGAVSAMSFAWHGYYDVVLAYVALSFPANRLEGRASRVAVGALLALFVARSLVRLLGSGPGFGYGGPGINPFNVLHASAAVEWLDIQALLPIAIVSAAVAGLAVRRWQTASPARRRLLVPVSVAALAGFGVTAAYGLDEYLHYVAGIDVIPWEGPGWTVPPFLARAIVPLGFLIAAIRLRTARSAAVDFASGLAEPSARSTLQDRLRRALGDPTLTVVYPADGGGWQGVDGSPRHLPSVDGPLAATTLDSPSGSVGAIIHDAALLEDPALVQTVANTTRLVLENERLRADLQSQLTEVRASRARISQAADDERRRIERDLHDGAQQHLVGLALTLRLLRARLGSTADASAVFELDEADRDVRAALDELRELARGLHPAILRQAGLRAALVSLAGRSPVPTAVEAAYEGTLPESVEAATYFVVAEALANIAKHAGAHAAVVRASRANGHFSVEIADDGRGGAFATMGGGLRGLADRVEAIGGTIVIRSPSGGGTSVLAEIPCGS